MINNRMISSASVVAKVIADLDLKEDLIRITDIREWIMEGILKIGAVQLYEHKVAILPIECHLVALPCDLYKLGQVAFSFCNGGGWLPMRKATSSFGVFHDRECSNEPCMLIPDTAMFPLVKNMFNLNTDREALEKLNEDTNLRQTLSILLNQWTVGTVNGKFVPGVVDHRDGTMFSNELQYTTKPGYINTCMPRGFVKISYYAIYTDEDSMPMIPDLESYKEAIYWYVTMKLMYPKKLKGQISQGDYYDIRNSYNFYRKLAYAEAMMPTVDDLETISNIYTKLYPEINDHSMFFSTSGDEQNIYNLNRL
ncbi:tail tubular protein [uncultured phage cr19_1]|uniref:tail tubular protein n=1 Tax=uncultured phage cr19_1 TaxID=2986420 RepID=UPI001C77C378|nr:tail tubular protein [uncultured phage cr19_1]